MTRLNATDPMRTRYEAGKETLQGYAVVKTTRTLEAMYNWMLRTRAWSLFGRLDIFEINPRTCKVKRMYNPWA